MEKAHGDLFSMLRVSEKYSVTLLRCLGVPRNGDTPADMQQLVNQRAKLRCVLWQPNFRPSERWGSKLNGV